MERLTYHMPEGGINIKGCALKPKETNGAVYLCICRLFDYENTGLTPQEVADLIRHSPEEFPEEYVHIGSEFAGYSVFALSDRICIAERIEKLGFDDYVVWNIDDDQTGVWGGVYFVCRQEALIHFSSEI